MTDDAQFIPEKKTEPADKVEKEWGLPKGMATDPNYDLMPLLVDYVEDAKGVILNGYQTQIAIALYAQAVSKPLPVNDPESHPDYEQVAKECFQRAKDTTPYLLREMGLLPKGDDDGA